MLVASWLVCSAFVPCRRSGRSRSPIGCVQVFRLLRCCSVPGVWGRHGTFVLCAAHPPQGRKAMTSGRTALKKIFPCRCPVPCPALAVLHAQSIIRYFVVLRSPTSSFACATHMCTPRRWQGPAGPPRCVPVLPMGAPGCCSSSMVLCSCSCLSVCRAPSRVVRCRSFGWCVCVTVLGVMTTMVRLVRLVLWCRDAPSDMAVSARRNTAVPVGRGVGAAPCGELLAPRMPWEGLWRTGLPGSVAAPLPLMDAVNCLRGVRSPYHSHRLYVS